MVVRRGIDRPNPQREAVRNRIEPAVAKWIAAEQPPGGEQETAGGAEAADRLRCVSRAGGLVTAAPWESWREPPLVGPDQSQEEAFHVERFFPAEAARASSKHSCTPLEPSRSIRPPISGRATRTKSCCGGSRSERLQ